MVLARVFTIGDATIICVRLVTIVRCVAEEWLRLNRSQRASSVTRRNRARLWPAVKREPQARGRMRLGLLAAVYVLPQN